MREVEKLMSGTYVVKEYITLCGVIQVLANHVPEPKSLVYAGLECWSPNLVKYGKGGDFSARISGRYVEVIDQHNKVVDSIPFKKFEVVESRKCVVADNGYLFSVGSKSWISRYTKALDQADRGEKPSVLDNSRFARVSPKLKGLKLIALERGSSDQKTKAVFMPNGTPVDFKESAPLAFKKWGETFTPSSLTIKIAENVFFD